MNNRRKSRSFTTIGFSSILIVFVMLALVTFTVLSVLTANADYRLSQKVADKTTSYYTANNLAEITLNDIDSRLLALYQDSASSYSFYRQLPDALDGLENVTITDTADTSASPVTVSYTVTISDTQYLDILLTIHYPQQRNGTFYTIEKWQTVTDTSDLDSSQTLHLLGDE